MAPPVPKDAVAALRAVSPAAVKDDAIAAALRTGDPKEIKKRVKRWWATEKKKSQWWRSLPASEQDPISLEPLRGLAQAPFELEEGGHKYRFDARVLAAYLVSSNVFANPLTRRPLDAAACARLDGHLAAHGLEARNVARALELSKDSTAARERERANLRNEARAILQALVGSVGGESLGARHRALQETEASTGAGGLQITDANAGAFAATDAEASAAARRTPAAPDPASAEAYP
eukprot:CAMPEP_0119268234 /NCGR_PEP_ID=MMETSP1329-20130426/6084_1 /TAXON_ID=114041 /ORGANISM="Genus nov. species nov., Strain RCC1024" /LENGTH=234 /DNA_ID=CAMNT_0007268197 /DNA_START=210 /DNA_END=911 /DNA_ORIENTATION=+